ncbi:MAG: ABC transporter ATP-binding protein [Candidatus Heimdallarchaeota archaeon]|nr:ABC transporter ATP-binding protein [Candidatus Heimdallarchaeota archaeon]MCK5048099.1 ABC transporter ATP-binding protein [Candidatus Heimdallarchaeota archaeon]
MSDSSAIILSNVTKSFGKIIAVDNLSLDIRKGEIYGLLGPNGAGKTTCINLLCGILEPDEGSITVLDYKIPSQKRKMRKFVGYMPQDLALYTDLTPMEHLIYYGGLYGMSKKAVEAKAQELFDIFGLTEKKNERVMNLSGGQKRRTSLLLALIHNPKLVVADEPTVGVDPALRRSFWKYFNGLTASGVSFLITTHVYEEVERADRVGFIYKGKLIEEGTPQEIRDKYNVTSLEEVFLAIHDIELTSSSSGD